MKALKIKDFPNYYITDTGEVYSRKIYNNPNGRIRKLKPNIIHGYEVICLRKNKKNFYKLVHRLVAQAFIPNPKNKREVNHKDGVKTNNNVENLEWTTSSENKLHASHVLGAYKHLKGQFGKNHPKSKVILQIKKGKIINKFYGSCEAQRYTGVPFSGILLCCHGKLKTSGGFGWKFEK
jgi:hypothetical protein